MPNVTTTFTVPNGWSPSSETSDFALGVMGYLADYNRGSNGGFVLLSRYRDEFVEDVNQGTRMRAIFELSDEGTDSLAAVFAEAALAAAADTGGVGSLCIEVDGVEVDGVEVMQAAQWHEQIEAPCDAIKVGELRDLLASMPASAEVILDHERGDSSFNAAQLVYTDTRNPENASVLLITCPRLVESVDDQPQAERRGV